MTRISALEIATVQTRPRTHGYSAHPSLLRAHCFWFWRLMPPLAGRNAVTRIDIDDRGGRGARSFAAPRQTISLRETRVSTWTADREARTAA
jgi:hypothetical protein